MMSEVQGEGVAFPAAMYFDDIKGEPMEQVFECHPNAETVAFEVIETEQLGYGIQPLHQG